MESPDPWPAQDWFKQPAQGRREPARRARPTRPDLPIRPAPSSRWARFAPSRVQWPWWVLCPWALISVLLHVHQAGQSWHFFAQGGQLLFGSGPGTGLQLYAAHPVLQIGPLALAVAGVLRLLGPDNGQVMAIAAMSVTGPLMLAGVWRLLPGSERRRNTRLLFAGLIFLPVWAELTTHFGHLDDLLALCFSVAALHAVARQNPVWAGLAVAAAVDAKPWAAAFVAILLALPRRQWLAALATFTGGVAVAWLPFLLADPHSLIAAQFTIPNDRSSALRVLGISAPSTPSWDRTAQIALGAVGGALAVWRGRWQAALLVAMAVRILLDPGVYAYYTSGVLLGTIVVDLIVTRWRVPWTTVAATALLYAARFTHKLIPFNLQELGQLRALFAIGLPLLILAAPGWWLARRPGRHARHAADPQYVRGPKGVPGPQGVPGPRGVPGRQAGPVPPGIGGPHGGREPLDGRNALAVGDQRLNSPVRDRLPQRTSRNAARPTSGRGALQVGQRAPWPGMLSQ